MRNAIKSHVPQPLLNFYGDTKRALEKTFKHVPPDERVRYELIPIYKGHFNVTYRGITTLRMPFDYVMYQMILCKIQPDLIIEIGSAYGGTTLYFADLMDILGHGMVHSIDINESVDPLAKKHPRIKLFSKGWDRYDLREAAGFNKILVIDDGSHLYEDVLAALNKFAPLVSVGS